MQRTILHIVLRIFATSTLQSSTTQAEEINRLTTYFFLAAGFILLVVTGLTTYVVIKYRHQQTNSNYTPKQPGKKWEYAMIGVPVVLVGLFLFLSVRTMLQVLPDAEGKQPDVIVTGHQWWWQAEYPAVNVAASNEIHLPVGKKVLVQLLAADVIHDWWIPEFGNKMDMIPGRKNYIWIHIKKPGTYIGACSEFCGAQHAGMRLRIIAQTSTDYQQWLTAQQQPAATVSDTLAQSGAQIFSQYTCGNCHNIAGTAANGKTGPDLTHIGSRHTLLTGLMINNPTNLESWLRDPQQIKPGSYMPNFYLDNHSLKALTAYLTSLK